MASNQCDETVKAPFRLLAGDGDTVLCTVLPIFNGVKIQCDHEPVTVRVGEQAGVTNRWPCADISITMELTDPEVVVGAGEYRERWVLTEDEEADLDNREGLGFIISINTLDELIARPNDTKNGYMVQRNGIPTTERECGGFGLYRHDLKLLDEVERYYDRAGEVYDVWRNVIIDVEGYFIRFVD